MSHFTVMVALPPEEVENGVEGALAEALQPFHEYECTGIRDQYVRFVDQTDELTQEYQTGHSTKCAVNKQTGEIVTYPATDKRFWRAATSDESSKFNNEKSKPTSFLADSVRLDLDGVHFKGSELNRDKGEYENVQVFAFDEAEWEIRDVPYTELHKTLLDYAKSEDGGGYEEGGDYHCIQDGKFGEFTNPDAKWDWWQIGGRWSGAYLLADGSRTDIARKGDIQFNKLIGEKLKAVMPVYDEFRKVIDENGGMKSWSETLSSYGKENVDDAREFYHNQPARKALGELVSSPFHDLDQYLVEREVFEKRKQFEVVSAFAILHKGTWNQKGNMGYWGMVANEKSPESWEDSFMAIFDAIPDDYTLVNVDCHI